MNYLQDARQHVLQQIKTACELAQRAPETVQLLAVSKTHQSERLREMYAAGQRAFGENYLQEALDKIDALQDLILNGISLVMFSGIKLSIWPSSLIGFME